jgi:hypothetical protein
LQSHSEGFGIEAEIRAYLADTPALIPVARCESGFRQFSDGSVLRGRENPADVGALQINETYHLVASQKLGMDIYTLKGNLDYGKYLYRKNGLRDWGWSAPCWSK